MSQTPDTSRIVFRHAKSTLDVFRAEDGSWYCSVQGEESDRGPFQTPGKAIEAGIDGAEQRAQAKAAQPKRKHKRKKSKAKIDRKYMRLE